MDFLRILFWKQQLWPEAVNRREQQRLTQLFLFCDEVCDRLADSSMARTRTGVSHRFNTNADVDWKKVQPTKIKPLVPI